MNKQSRYKHKAALGGAAEQTRKCQSVVMRILCKAWKKSLPLLENDFTSQALGACDMSVHLQWAW